MKDEDDDRCGAAMLAMAWGGGCVASEGAQAHGVRHAQVAALRARKYPTSCSMAGRLLAWDYWGSLVKFLRSSVN